MLRATLPLLLALAALSPAAAAEPPRRTLTVATARGKDPADGRGRIDAPGRTASAPPPPAPDAPPAGGKMIRIRFRDVTRPLPAGSFGAKPKTLYRLGEKYGRIEEEPDPERRIHGLIVVSEPKVWMVNLADMSGQTATDPGPSFVFRAPIIPLEQGGPQPPMLEMGLEYDFLRAHGARSAPGRENGTEQLTATVDGYAITLVGDAGKARPRRIRVTRGGETLAELEYLDYRSDLPPRMELFVPPPDVRYRER